MLTCTAQTAGAPGGKFRRNRSTTHVIIGVLAQASGKGLGTGLLEEAKRWAAARDLHRIELNVMAHNHRAIALYERAGLSAKAAAWTAC
jgi:RimJ/RimL family protein N-acetyltransferase